MRETIYRLLRKTDNGDWISKGYDLFIMAVAFVSILPLTVKPSHQTGMFPEVVNTMEIVTVYILFMDYIFRWIVHDYISGDDSVWAFVRYPFTPFAIVDLLSLLPSIGLLGPGFMILRLLRIFKILHYSKSFQYMINVFRNERRTLLSVLLIALAYIFFSALVMFTYEPETFDNFFHALYWATTALTTVGYGDVYPKTQIGMLISMLSSLFGIAVIAMPAGIVTAGFIEEVSAEKERRGEDQNSEEQDREDQGRIERNSEEQHGKEQDSEEQHGNEQDSEERHKKEQNSEEQSSQEQHGKEQDSEEQNSEERNSGEQGREEEDADHEQ